MSLKDRLAWADDDLEIVETRAAEFDESKHPREPGGSPKGGEFTSSHGGGDKFSEGAGGATVKKAPPATKDQIQQAWEMKQKGASYAQIQKATGLNPKQAATIVHKVNKKLKDEEAKAKAKAESASGKGQTAAYLTGDGKYGVHYDQVKDQWMTVGPNGIAPEKFASLYDAKKYADQLSNAQSTLDKTPIGQPPVVPTFKDAYKEKGFDNSYVSVKKNLGTGKWEVKDANGKVVAAFYKKAYAADNAKAFKAGTLQNPGGYVTSTLKPSPSSTASIAKEEIPSLPGVKVPIGTTVNGSGDIFTPGANSEAGKAYEWKEKTSGPQAGKYAYFLNGVQVSSPKGKEEWKDAAKTIHQGLGPGNQAAAPKVPAYKPYVDDKIYNEVVAKGTGKTGEWPIEDSVIRTAGTKYKETMQAAGNEWKEKLTSAERGSVHSYTGSGYAEINAELRKPGGPTSSLSSIKNIESAIEKHADPPPPELVWRGISHGSAQTFAKDLGPGDIVTLKGFQSTSISPDKAHSWGNGQTIYEIKPSKGAYVRVISGHPHEYEYLLPHGQEYVVRGHTSVKFSGYGDKVKVVQLEALPYQPVSHKKAA